MADTRFRAYTRPGISGAVDDPAGTERRRLKLSLTALIEPVLPGSAESAHGMQVFELPGPGDVAGLVPAAIRRVSPPDGSGDVDGEYCAYVDLVAADLPWRYLPAGEPKQGGLAPWLAVIAGEEGVEVGLDVAGRAWVVGSVTADVDPGRARSWAHVHHHVEQGRFEAARVLCPRALPQDASCLAVVVPLLTPDGAPRWQAGTPVAGLPVLHAWRFRTNASGTFLDLAAALKPVAIPDGLGVAWLAAPTRDGGTSRAPTFGLLAPIGAEPGPWADPDVHEQLRSWLEPASAPDSAPVVGPPLYGSAWVAGVTETVWGRQLNYDPRHRAVAGLGVRAGIDWQQAIVDAASRRLGQTHLAARMLSDLTTGVELSRRLLRRQPGGAGHAPDAATAARRLAFQGPALRKIRSPDGGTTLDRVTGETSPLSPALLSAAAQRLSSPSGTLSRVLMSAREDWSPGAAILALDECPRPPGPLLPVHEPTSRPAEWDVVLGRLQGVLPTRSDLPESGRGEDPEFTMGWLPDDPEDREPPCTPVDPVELVGELDRLLDPAGAAVTAVLSRIEPRPARHDVPYVVEPDLDLPAWAWLRDRAPEWLLPGAGLIAPDSVVALRSNGAFMEAFLVGLSQQGVGELRWRGVPCAPGTMPMRTLWQRVRTPEDAKVRPDISNVRTWDLASPLDDPGHRVGDDDLLVLVLHSDILRRYPDTVIRLARRSTGDPALPDLDDPGDVPAAVGRISAALWFIAFDVHPDLLEHRFLVLEETVEGPRFAPPRQHTPGDPGSYDVVPDGELRATTVDDGAEYAKAAWRRPVRAVIDGSRLTYPAPRIGGP